MGKSEEETLEDIKEIVKNITEQERVARNRLKNENYLRLEDKIYRAYGIFSNARIITSEEFMKLASDVRLGVNMGIINSISLQALNKLMVGTQPANIMETFGEGLSAEERDQKRAQLIRESIRA
jgi:protein arginine kinase